MSTAACVRRSASVTARRSADVAHERDAQPAPADLQILGRDLDRHQAAVLAAVRRLGQVRRSASASRPRPTARGSVPTSRSQMRRRPSSSRVYPSQAAGALVDVGQSPFAVDPEHGLARRIDGGLEHRNVHGGRDRACASTDHRTNAGPSRCFSLHALGRYDAAAKRCR